MSANKTETDFRCQQGKTGEVGKIGLFYNSAVEKTDCQDQTQVTSIGCVNNDTQTKKQKCCNVVD